MRAVFWKASAQLCERRFHLHLWSLVVLIDRELECFFEGSFSTRFVAEREIAFADENLNHHPVRLLRERDLKMFFSFREFTGVVERFAETEAREFVLRELRHHLFVTREVAHNFSGAAVLQPRRP